MRKQFLTILTAALCLGLLGGCSADQFPSASVSPSAMPVPSEPAVLHSASLPSSTPEATPAPSPTAAPTPTPTPAAEPYILGQAVEEADAVDEDYFSDAVFLGDSRTEGLQLYSGLQAEDFFWHKGMTVFRVDDPEKRVIQVDGEKMTMMEALSLKQYAKVYIMIGINELGYPHSSYNKGLRTMVDRVKELQPGAIIYLQTLPPVNERKAGESGLGSYINNENVNAFNDIVVQTAADKGVALLDVASVFRTEAGDLDEDMAADGVHFYRAGYQIWAEYLKTHTLTAAEYAAAVPGEPESSIAPAESEAPEVSADLTDPAESPDQPADSLAPEDPEPAFSPEETAPEETSVPADN